MKLLGDVVPLQRGGTGLSRRGLRLVLQGGGCGEVFAGHGKNRCKTGILTLKCGAAARIPGFSLPACRTSCWIEFCLRLVRSRAYNSREIGSRSGEGGRSFGIPEPFRWIWTK